MSGANDDCRPVREALLDLALEGRSVSELSGAAAKHLGSCPECERFGRGLRPSPATFGRAPLYTDSLRRRTLAAVAAAEGIRLRGLVSWLVPAAITSVAASFVGPVWLVTRWLGTLIPSGWLALGVAVLLCSSLGFAATGAVLVALAKIHGGRAGREASMRPADRRPS